MSDFLGFVGKESLSLRRKVMANLDTAYLSNSFHCYYGKEFDLSVYEDDLLFVVSLGYLSGCKSKIDSMENLIGSCATNIANLYKSHLEDFYDFIDGNFSFCIFDKVTNKTMLGRDKMGSRPLYICVQEDCFLFSSNQKLFLNNDSIKLSLDSETMASYLALKPQQCDKTFFNEIKRLKAFTVLFVDNKSRDFLYRKYSFDAYRFSALNVVQEFKHQFERAIKRCWKDTDRIGLMFSGGLDSSSIAAGLKKCGFNDIQSFSCNYSHLPESTRILADEGEFQASVIKKLNLSHTQIELRDVSPLKSLIEQFKYFAEPTHFPNLYMFDGVALEAKSKRIDVIFDGQDGDSVISHGLERFRELAGVGNIFGFLYELFCYSKFNNLKFRRVFRNILGSILKNWGMIKHTKDNSSVLNEKVFRKYFTQGNENVTAVDSHFEKLNNAIHALAFERKYLVFKNYGIHVRSPFYDKDLMEFCLNIPSKWKLRNGKTRFILRKYLSTMGLEKVSLRRKKANLGHGLVDNIRRLDIEKIRYELEEIHPYLRDFLDQERVDKYFEDFISMEGWDDQKLMGILSVLTANHWLKNEVGLEFDKFKEA